MIRTNVCFSLALPFAVAACGETSSNANGRSPDFALGSGSAPSVCPANSTLIGIDVSHYQSSVDWTAVASGGATFAFAKATEGLTVSDAMFATNWPAMQQAGITRGAYHYFHPADDGTQQADFFLAAVGDLQAGDLLPALDMETTDNQPIATVIAQMSAFLSEVLAQTGINAMIYTSPSFWTQLGSPTQFTNNPLWIANYDTTCPGTPGPWSAWQIWQNSGAGGFSGVSGSVDLDEFNGAASDLQALTVGGVGAANTPANGACVVDGAASNAGDGSDCCSGSYDSATNLCGPVGCIADGSPSIVGDGSDCCTGSYDSSTNICGPTAACVPDGSSSNTGNGSDCCSSYYDLNTNLCGCVPTGDPSLTIAGSDCCSGVLGADGSSCG